MKAIRTDNNLFYIETADTCYVFAIVNGFAEHLYYGAKIPFPDCGALIEKRGVLLVNTLYPIDDPTYGIDAKGFEFSLPLRGDGEIRAVRLTEDMSGIEADTDILLFKASANTYEPYRGKYKVTDGPFLFSENGRLCMLWSTHTRSGKYVQLSAYSDNGRIDGKWLQKGEPLYAGDGGHGMIFDDLDGKRYLVLHTPNVRKIFTREYEHPVMLDIARGADEG